MFKFLFKTNLFIAFAAVAFLWSNIFLLKLDNNYFVILSLQVFFSAWFIYQYSRWVYYKKGNYPTDEDEFILWFKKHPHFNRFTLFLSFVLSLGLAFFLNIQTLLLLLFIGGISILYPLAVLSPIGLTTRLRDIPLLKIFLIAFVWSFTSVLLPVLECGKSVAESRDIYPLLFLQFIFIVFICLPFDINDLRSDYNKGLKTIPVIFGIKTTKIIMLLLGGVYLLGLFFWFLYFTHSMIIVLPFFLMLCLLIFFLQWFAWYKSEYVKKWQISVVYDGSMVIYFFCILFLKLRFV